LAASASTQDDGGYANTIRTMRIASLLPGATEIICALGLRDQLTGRSHACDYPADVADVPVLTFSRFEMDKSEKTDAAQIDSQITEHARANLSLFGIAEDRLAAAQPDLVITQGLCAVCAVSADTTQRVVRNMDALAGANTRVLSLEPISIDGIFDAITAIAGAAGVPERGVALNNALRTRIAAIQDALAGITHRPSVAALEWLNPPFSPGHWVPEQITLAGGRSALGDAGAPSVRITWDDVSWVQPEMVLLMPCGYDAAAAAAQFDEIAALELWRDVPATYLNQIYAVDANGLFSRPGPRVVDGIEVLARLLHPNRFGKANPSEALRVSHLVVTQLRDD
jgi:iron complex transport system substrate-binding protein